MAIPVPSICRYLSSIKAVYKYLLIENILDIDPSDNIHMPKKVGKTSEGLKHL